MIAKELIQQELDDSSGELITVINGFSDRDFNLRVSENSWSAGEVVEHLIKLDKLLIRLLEGNSKPSERNPEEKMNIIKTGFLDISKKYNSPKFMIPADNNQNKNDCINKITEQRKKIKELIEFVDLSLTYPELIHPVFGEMSGVEWVYSIIYHLKRHIFQIKEIETILSERN